LEVMIVSLVIGSDIPITKQEMAVTFNSIYFGCVLLI